MNSLLLLEAVKLNDIEKVRELISHFEINPDNAYQSLIEAIDKEHLEILTLLVNARLDVNFELLDGIPLERAVMKRNLFLVKLLLEGSADANYPLKSNDNYTPLYSAACNGDIDIVKLLVEAGANVNCVWGNNWALDGAARSGHAEVYNYLYPLTKPKLQEGTEESLLLSIRIKLREELANPQTNALTTVVSEGNLCKVKEIISNGADINDRDADGLTALIKASARGNLSIIQELLALGANPNVTSDDGDIALIGAIGESSERLQICSNLIKFGADVNAQNNDGKTALMAAANLGSTGCIKLLLKMNADINLRDIEGRSALDYALLHSQDNYFWACNVNYPGVIEILQYAERNQQET